MGQNVGRIGRIVTSFCVVLYCFGTTVSFLITIGDQFDQIFQPSIVGDYYHNQWYTKRQFTIFAASLIFILPLCFSKKIDFLRIPSLFGVIAVMYLVLLLPSEYFRLVYMN